MRHVNVILLAALTLHAYAAKAGLAEARPEQPESRLAEVNR